MIDSALGVAGVDQPIRDDIRLMLTEACSNVVIHALTTDEYDVSADVFEDRCVIKVMDAGDGFTADAGASVSLLAEHGHGLQIMRALADEIRLTNYEDNGAVVWLEKSLHYGSETPGRTLHTAHGGVPRQETMSPDGSSAHVRRPIRCRCEAP
jgi:serine/threonine-protein kinase RsbW